MFKKFEELFDKDGRWITDNRYQEIICLHKMLESENIPHDFTKMQDGWHIEYPAIAAACNRVCSVVEHHGSYGSEKDLLEIMGLVSKEEAEDGVKGNMAAKEVFERIKKHFQTDFDRSSMVCIEKSRRVLKRQIREWCDNIILDFVKAKIQPLYPGSQIIANHTNWSDINPRYTLILPYTAEDEKNSVPKPKFGVFGWFVKEGKDIRTLEKAWKTLILRCENKCDTVNMMFYSPINCTIKVCDERKEKND